MRNVLMTAVFLLLLSGQLPAAAADDMSGSWSGPWYRGMTSGTMVLDIAPNGSGTVQFTNLDNFGEDTVPLSNLKQSDKSLDFSAAGAGPDLFKATVRLAGNGSVLAGKGEYDGFPIKFKLKRR